MTDRLDMPYRSDKDKTDRSYFGVAALAALFGAALALPALAAPGTPGNFRISGIDKFGEIN